MSAFSVFWWRVSEFAAKRCNKYWFDKKNQEGFNRYFDNFYKLERSIKQLKKEHEVELLQKDEEMRRLSDLVYELDKELRE